MSPNPPTDLRCESLREPLGIGIPYPRLSWIVAGPRRGDRQTAYQVLVSSERALCESRIGDYWDSGRVESPRTCNIEYGGEPLLSCKRFFWRVRWWDGAGAESPWSDVGSFLTAYLAPSEWKPKWIGMAAPREFRSRPTQLLGGAEGEHVQAYAVYLRKEFELKGKPIQAFAFICGLGWSELYLNGERVGDRVLDPAWTDYRKHALYSAYDVTRLILPINAAAVILGNGRHIRNYGFEAPRVTLRLEIEYESGEREIVGTDETWKTAHGPLKENGVYYGERYDARFEMAGWDRVGFDDSNWAPAAALAGYPLRAQMMPPIRVAQTLRPAAVTPRGPGTWIADFGQNLSGWVRLRLQGPRGTEVRLRHAEVLHPDGSLNVLPNENAEAADIYVLKGGGVETYEPRFTYHGFRYVEASGFPGEPGPDALEACFVHSDVERTGEFACSNLLLTDIHRNVLWGQLSNLMGIPTDCPQRDERQGWLGDAALSAEEALFNFDMAAFYAKFLEDIREAQREDGSLPDFVPPYIPRTYPGDPAWAGAYPELVWLHYLHYEDIRILQRHFNPIRKYLEFLERSSVGGLQTTLGKYGDWCPPGSIFPKKTPVDLTSTWFYYRDIVLAARMAKLVGGHDAAKRFESLAAEVKEAFNQAYLKDDQYAAVRSSRLDLHPSQTSNALPLYLDMVPGDKREAVLRSLLKSVVDLCDHHLDTGILGTRYLPDVLTDNGYGEAAYRIATQTTYPGWGYMLERGATTLWERWEYLAGRAMNSHNHIMFGSVDAWFYRAIAGLSPLEPGWKAIRVKPGVFGDLARASAAVRTIRGRAEVAWRREPGLFELDVLIPIGSTAHVHIPRLWEKAEIREGSLTLWKSGESLGPSEEVALTGQDDREIVFNVRCGRYAFRLTELKS